MKITSKVRTLAVLITLAFVACVLFCIFAPSKDYTEDYKVYKNVSSITSTYELMDYCHSNNVDYSIDDGTFEMKGLAISVSVDKADCVINSDKRWNNFYLLENGRATCVETKTVDGQEVKIQQIKTWGTNYQMCDGTFIAINMWPALIAFAVTLILTLVLVNCWGQCMKCSRCNQR